MRGNFFIDGLNAYDAFGVWIVKGGYKDLLKFPAMTEPEKNDWPEEDGVEVELSDP